MGIIRSFADLVWAGGLVGWVLKDAVRDGADVCGLRGAQAMTAKTPADESDCRGPWGLAWAVVKSGDFRCVGGLQEPLQTRAVSGRTRMAPCSGRGGVSMMHEMAARVFASASNE